MTYNIMDWACDQIRAYEANHRVKPECFLVTPTQAISLMEAVSAQTRISRSPGGFMESIRKGEAFLCGVPLKLIEARNAQ